MPDRDLDLSDLAQGVSNWGRWGADDELGTLNHISDAQRARGQSLVRSGRIVSLSRETALKDQPGLGDGRHEVSFWQHGSEDYVGLTFHGFAVTHLDALCHFFHEGKMYNGFSSDDVKPDGARRGSSDKLGNGIAGRGVLFDIAALKGRACEPGESISAADLQAVAERQHLAMEPGDIVWVRTGCVRYLNTEGRAGLGPDCLPWLHQNRVALLGTDGAADVFPTPYDEWAYPIHRIGLVFMGLHLVDNADLDPLAQACEEQNRWEFFCSIA
ncbi:MAG TPA: cyclase family protein, partial [Dehalococcoidia bacterium]|nr:cyclase family protein [Dehalococcoidia bacterium]